MNPYKFILSKMQQNMREGLNFFYDPHSHGRFKTTINLLRLMKEDAFNHAFNDAYQHLMSNVPDLYESSTIERMENVAQEFYLSFFSNIGSKDENEMFKIDLGQMPEFNFVNNEIVETTCESSPYLKSILLDLLRPDVYGDIPDFLEFVLNDFFISMRRKNRRDHD